jgi:ATP/maltotriose-dependent transcriptional regulator MalT
MSALDKVLEMNKHIPQGCSQQLTDAIAELAALRKQVAEARKVIEPFAIKAEKINSLVPDDDWWTFTFTAKSFRAAAAWLKGAG